MAELDCDRIAIRDIEAPAQAELVCHLDFSANAAARLRRHAEPTR